MGVTALDRPARGSQAARAFHHGTQVSAPHCLTLSPSFQIPVTQACLMEDIEQWLSTDVVSRGPPSPETKVRRLPRTPDSGLPFFLVRR